MLTVGQPPHFASPIRLRPIALPVEHGGWSLLLEPIALGLLLAPSPANVLLSACAIALFLARHPYKLAVNDWRKNRQGQRATLAGRFALLYLFVALVTAGFTIRLGGLAFLLPFVFAAPIVLIQLALDSLGRSRSLAAELAGSIATGSLATAMSIGGGWPRASAFALWLIVAARAVPTILYLRTRLRLMRGKPASRSGPLIAHLTALLAIVTLSGFALAPRLAVVAMLVLLIRAGLGLYRSGNETTPRRLGIAELVLGVMTVFAVAMGFRFEL
jgi:hypothetical protein